MIPNRRSFAFAALLTALLSTSLRAQSVLLIGAQTAVQSAGNDGLAFNANGDLFIDWQSYGILKLAVGKSLPSTIYSGNTADVAVDPAGNVFALLNSGSVVELPNGGIGAPVTFVSGLNKPMSLATDSLGDLFVADTGNHRILKVTPAGTQTTIGSGFVTPQSVAVDLAGNVYVGDVNSLSIMKVTPTGTQTTFVSNITTSRLAVDSAGNLYVSTGYPTMYLIAPDGTQTPIPIKGTPYGVAVDLKGNLAVGVGYPQSYVSAYPFTNLILVGQSGPSVNAFGGLITCPAGGKGVDYVVSGACNAIESFNYKVTIGGTLATVALTDGAPNQEFTVINTTCSGAVATGSTCNVQVNFNPRYPGLRRGAIQIVDASGKILNSTLVYGFGTGPQLALDSDVKTKVGAGFAAPAGAVVDGSGNIYIADYTLQSLVKLAPSGTVLKQVAANYLVVPGVALDGAGNIYAPSSSNVMKYSPDLASSTIVATGLNNPGGVAVDEMGSLFVAESTNADVVKIPVDGSARIVITTPGNPASVSVDPIGNLYVTVSGSNSVIEIPADGASQKSLGTGFTAPKGVVADKLGNVYVADSGNGRVVEIPTSGTQKVITSGLKDPAGIALGATGDLIVTDDFAGVVYSVVRSQGPTLTFADTPVITTSSDSPRTVILENIGNAGLTTSTIGSVSLGDFAMNLDCGDPCELKFSFTPRVSGPLTNSYSFLSNTLYAQYGFIQSGTTIALQGNGVSGSTQPFITGQSLGPVRNNYSGYVGFQFSVGATPISISSLGRFVAPGNSATHILKLVNSDGTDVPGGMTSVVLSGQPAGQYAYASLASPVTLVSNTYFMVSQETAGGDQWYDLSSVTSTAIANVNAPVYSDAAGRYVPVTSLPGKSYVPLSFRGGAVSNPAPPVPFVTAQTLGAVRNDYSGFVGFSFTPSYLPLTIHALGRFVAPGNNGTHVLKLVDSNGVDVPGSTVSVSTVGATPGQFIYANLPSPITLNSVTHYYMVSQEIANGDQWYDRSSVTSTPSAATLNTPIYTDASGTYVMLSYAFHDQSYVPLNFLYTLPNSVTSTSTSLLVSASPGPVRNDYTGNVGMAIKTGAATITVTDLGTFVATSDVLSHTLKLVTASGADVPGGSVSISLSAATPNGFSFAPLAVPVILAANTTYYLVVSETARLDPWFDLGPVASTSAAQILGPVYADAAGNYILVPGLPNYAYVPVSLRYQ